MSQQNREKQIVRAWQQNADPWIEVIAGQKIESRRLITDQAVIDTVMTYQPRSVLDLGCGEGWLVRALARIDPELSATGVDVIAELIARAQKGGSGQFYQLAYEEVSTVSLGRRFDLIVCNFSLLGHSSVDNLFARMGELLSENGRVVVQTLHPLISGGEEPYRSGWREGTWAGIEGDFSDPAPWYFRTMSDWFGLFRQSGLLIEAVREPIDPRTGKPASLIMVGQPCSSAVAQADLTG